MLEYGTVVEVSEVLAGSTLVADAASGATVLPVADASDFDESGGELSLNGAVLTYTAVDMAADTITLDAMTPVVDPALADDMVTLYPDAPVRTAMVTLTHGGGDSVLVRVPHHLSAMLPHGIREVGQQESVTIDRSSSWWVIQDVIGRPAVVQGEAVDVSTLEPIENISPDYTYPGSLPMDRVDGGVIRALFQTPDVGEGVVQISDLLGIQSLRPDGSARFDLPNSDERSITIDAEIIARAFTSLGAMAIRGTDNEVAKDAVITLSRGTTQPVTPPSVSISWDSIGVDDPLNLSQYWYGLAWVSSTSAWYVVDTFGANGALAQFNPTTGAPVGLSYSVGVEPLGGVTYLGGNLYVLGKRVSGQFGQIVKWYVEIYNTSGVKQGEWLISNSDYPYLPAIGNNGTNLLVGRYASSAFKIHARNPSTGALVGSEMTTTSSSPPPAADVAAIIYGTCDFGSFRYVVIPRQSSSAVGRVFDTAGAEQNNDRFTVADGARVAGMAWDGTNFRSLGQGTAKLYTYTGIRDCATPWYVGNTWRKADATGPDFAQYETTLGAPRKFTMARRANVTVTSAPIPSVGSEAPDSITLYFGTGASMPSNANFFRRATPGVGVTSVKVTDMTFTGGNPPALGNFPGATPATIASDDPTLLTIDGNGKLTAPRKMQAGGVTVTMPTVNSTASTTVTFPVPMAAAPVITFGLVTPTGSSASLNFWASNVTATGFTFNAQTSAAAGGARSWSWIAMVP